MQAVAVDADLVVITLGGNDIMHYVNGLGIPNNIPAAIDGAKDAVRQVVGNVTRDPELRYTASGIPVAEFGVAWNTKDKAGNESVSFFDVTCWRDLAEHVAESLRKGHRVIVHGRLDQNTWETKEGDKRSKVRVMAEDVAPSLRWATATVERVQRAGSDSTWRPVGDGKSAMERGGFPTDEEPF